MSGDSQIEYHELLGLARDGCVASQGELLERYRKLLKMLVRVQIHGALKVKADASDIVQETFLRAYQTFSQFRGATERELINWLRAILASRLAKSVRRHNAERRSLKLERHLSDELERSSAVLDRAFVQPGLSPSEAASQRERVVLVANAIEDLPEDYRTVILLRHIHGMTYPEVAAAMERSVFSVQKLWVRALAQLQQAMEGQS